MGTRQPVCESWWAVRFMEGLVDGDHARMARGRTYLCQGAVTELTVDPARGAVSARVRGSRPRPYGVSILYQSVEGFRWDRILGDLAEDGAAAEDLWDGQMPEETEDVFARHGVRLFPDSIDDLDIHCTCPDRGHPCKHGAAVLYAIASVLDEDPGLLLAWLGRTKDEVFEALDGPGGRTGPTGELEVEVAPLTERVPDFWAPTDPVRLAPPRTFDPLAHWEGATPGVSSRLAPMYARFGKGAVDAAPHTGGRRR